MSEAEMTRGSWNFEVTSAGDLTDSGANVAALRDMWLDRSVIDGRLLGPGNRGDFDNGAWHVACHLLGAGGVRRTARGELLWLEISHDKTADDYFASVTGGAARDKTVRLDSADGQQVLRGSQLLGFVEGNSVGRISARGANDPRDRFNGWTRQQFDKPPDSDANGGKVWEHWCTVRDIRPAHRIGASVLKAYVTLCAALGDRFAPTVARGRRDYSHPEQLCAMVRGGFTSEGAATWDTSPVPIPPDAEEMLLTALPDRSLSAARQLQWDGLRYYMFTRRIDRWSPASSVRRDLAAFSA